jgi:hypothetical protein
MINGNLRPWGRPEWLFRMPSIAKNEWFLIGCVSTQDRCKSILLHNEKSINISKCGFIEIIDAPSSFSNRTADRIRDNLASIQALLPAGSEIVEIGLLDPMLPLKKKLEVWIASSGGNVVFDVSTFPERFCFPILRWLFESPEVKNLAVTYMLPEAYTADDLGFDSQDWGQLPTFVNEMPFQSEMVEHVIVGVGFLPYSLPDWLKKTYDKPDFKISLLMPFPASPSNVNRAWEFIRRIEGDLRLKDDRQIIRISAHDLSGAFQRISSLTGQGKSQAVFAPYGPKAHSIAMCLHALRHSSEAYFTQPTYYHPEYSTGIQMHEGLPAGYAYAVRANGAEFY